MLYLSDLAKKTLYKLINLEYLKEKNENEKKIIVQGVLKKIEITHLFQIKQSIIEKIISQEDCNNSTNNLNNDLLEIQSTNSTKEASISNNNDSFINQINFTDNNYLDDKIIDNIYKKIIDIRLYPGDTLNQRKIVFFEWIRNILPNLFKDIEELI